MAINQFTDNLFAGEPSNEQDLLNIIGDQKPFRDVMFSGGFQKESLPTQQKMFQSLRGQGISDENLMYSLTKQFGADTSNYWKDILSPAPVQPQVPPTPSGVVQPPAMDVVQNLRDAGLKQQPFSLETGAVPPVVPAVNQVSRDAQIASVAPTVAQQPVIPDTGSPEWFKQYIYQGGADDAAATQRGLQYVIDQGMKPLDAVNLWNQALGTDFSVNDYFRTSGLQAPSRSVVFGDSISSVLGYNPDGSTSTEFGRSLQDVLSNYTGGLVDNVATGGETSADALAGKGVHGGFENYLSQNKPDQVILRYGAADAIKLGDAGQSLGNIEQMINLSKQYGAKPVLVGVSPFFGGADSIGGNIAGYLTRESATVADQINDGMKQLADKYGLQFVDVRDIQIPAGSLLDGVHQDGRFGRLMADKIGSALQGEEPKKETGIAQLAQESRAVEPVEASAPLSFFGEEGGWNVSSEAGVDAAGQIYSPGKFFERGDDIIVSDEIFWNPNVPVGDALRDRVEQYKSLGKNPGIVISPYAALQGGNLGREDKVSDKKMLDEIANSGASFVAFTPYLGYFDMDSKTMYDWMKNFVSKVRDMGKDVKIVLNGWAEPGKEKEYIEHNKRMMSIPGVSEYVVFGGDKNTPQESSIRNMFARDGQSRQRAINEPERRFTLDETTSANRMARGGMAQGLGSLVRRTY